MTHYTTQCATPEAWITRNQNRLKQYAEKTVYLNDGDEFEIELYNPTTKSVLAKISLNGVLTSQSGIVLKPGQRVYLDRYLDKAQRYKFETYEVKNSAPTKAAIVNNGNLRVDFYDEYTPPSYFGNTFTTYGTNPYFGSTLTSGTGSFTCSSAVGTSSTRSFVSQDSLSFLKQELEDTNSKSIETGRVEAGSASSQNFTTVDMQFNSYSSWSSSWKMLPVSQKKTISPDELKSYCTQCGTKAKKGTWKFCPNCGSSYK